jgi:hypothetical protein
MIFAVVGNAETSSSSSSSSSCARIFSTGNGMVPISRKLKATDFRNLRYLEPAFFSLAIYITPK